MRHYSYFNRHVLNPIKRYGYVGDGRRAMLTLKNQVLDKIMLRRTKEERAADIMLPPLSIHVQKLQLDPHERDFYECVYKQTRSRFDTYVNKGTLLHNYAHIFELLSRLRQAVDHPYLVVHGDFRGKHLPLPSKSAGVCDVCGICGLDITETKDIAISSCRHTFHKSCIEAYVEQQESLLETRAEAEEIANAEKKKNTVSKRKKRKRTKGTKKQLASIGCPVCFLPLSLTVNVRATSSDNKGDATCIICMDKPADTLLLPCGHMYTCYSCTQEFRERNNRCPICRASVTRVLKNQRGSTHTLDDASSPATTDRESEQSSAIAVGRRSIMQQINVENFATSSKVEAVLSTIQGMINEDATHKAIIFSQYTKMIDIVEWRLMTAGFRVVTLMGSMSLQERQNKLRAFKEQSDISCLIMSLKAGGEGLNLQEASHVLILEPWWNPAVEAQAIQRAHRIGQQRPVTAIRYITENSIEDRMLQLQKKKELVFKGTIDSSAIALSQLTSDDLRFLFH